MTRFLPWGIFGSEVQLLEEVELLWYLFRYISPLPNPPPSGEGIWFLLPPGGGQGEGKRVPACIVALFVH